MRTLAVLIAASSLAWTSTARAGTPKTSSANAQAVQKQMQHQQQLYQQEMRRQQELEKKLAHQQQQAYQQQMKAAQEMEKKLVHRQQQANQQQINHAEAQQHKSNAQPPTVAHHVATPSATTANVVNPTIVHGTASHHHGSGYRSYYHRNNRTYRHYNRWPNQVDPETAALVRLKNALDAVGRGQSSTSKHTGTLATALGNVVEVEKPPSPVAVRQLAEHLTTGLSHREAAPADTRTMALALRAVMNSTVLPKNELIAVMNEHRAALRSAKLRPDDVSAIQASLQTISDQERRQR